MATRVKCIHCLGCMIARWVNNNRYYYCDLCKIWYGGRIDNLIEVADPNTYNLSNEMGEKKE